VRPVRPAGASADAVQLNRTSLRKIDQKLSFYPRCTVTYRIALSAFYLSYV
jgi:hypothetical protein